MNAEIIAVGTELLMGQIANTNAQHISMKLPEVGVNVFYHCVVGDNPERVKDSLKLALSRSDVVITTGGLGPTQDDLTKEMIAEFLGLKMVMDGESLRKIEVFFQKLGRPMTESNKKQAMFPEGSIILTNSKGTAPGAIVLHDGKIIIMLPGPPYEMKPMFDEQVLSYFASKTDTKLLSRFIKVFGIGESKVEEMLMTLIDNQTNPTLATYAKEGQVLIRVSYQCTDENEGHRVLMDTQNKILSILGDRVYSCEGKELHEVVADILIQKNITLSIAESCTGGLIAATLTNVPGISSILDRGIVTYSNNSKIEELGVQSKTLEAFGAVSRETASEMALGVRNKSKSAVGLSITGIAGPGGGTEEKPVGTVYIAIASDKGIELKELKLTGDRERIRNQSCLLALDFLRGYLNTHF